MNTEDSEFERIEREQATRGVPDLIHHTDTSESLEYITGWNDCRQAMLEQPAPAAQQEPVAWAVYWGYKLGQKHSVHFDRKTADAVASDIVSFPVEVRPLSHPQTAPRVVDCHATGVCVQSGLRAEQPAPAAQPAREPTKAMIDAAERIDWSDSDVRGNVVNMWQAMCAAAPQAPAVPVRQELWGWAILHSDGTDAHVRSRITDFFGQIKEREPFSDDRLKQCDLYWAGLAPHRIVELYIRDNTPQAQPAQPLSWIATADQMPPPNVRVFWMHQDSNRVGYDTWMGDDFRFTPSHWMPIPALQAPKENT